jgi:predicted AAA+ superfamily ATPase
VDGVLFRDVVERHDVSNVSALRALIRHVLQQRGSALSVTRLYNDFRSQGIPVSKDTHRGFVDHPEDAILLRAVEIHARSERHRRVNPRKVYLADHSLSSAFQQPRRYDRGHHLENIVAAEVFGRNRFVHYYRTTAGIEVDSLAQDPDTGESLTQVAMDVASEATIEQETRGLREAAKRRRRAKLVLLTETDPVWLKGDPSSRIRIMPVWQWLCGIEAGAP